MFAVEVIQRRHSHEPSILVQLVPLPIGPWCMRLIERSAVVEQSLDSLAQMDFN